MPYYYRGFDPTYLLVLIGAVICLLASARVKSTFHKYSGRRSMSGMTGAQAAERILRSAGIYDVTICHIGGSLTDNYNPSRRTLNLSDDVYGATSVAAIGVAAHECGHAIQHQQGYAPLSIRDRAGREYRFHAGVAPDPHRYVFYDRNGRAADQYRDFVLFRRGTFSACHASRGI